MKKFNTWSPTQPTSASPFLRDNPTAYKCMQKSFREILESLSLDAVHQFIHDIVGQVPFLPVCETMLAAGQEHKYEKLAQDVW